MGMQISGAQAAWSSPTNSSVGSVQSRQQAMKDLFSSLQSGDLAGAQHAYAVATKNMKVDSHSPLGQLGQALQKGDLTGARKIAQSMQTNQSSTPSPAQALTRAASTLATLRSQAANVDVLA